METEYTCNICGKTCIIDTSKEINQCPYCGVIIPISNTKQTNRYTDSSYNRKQQWNKKKSNSRKISIGDVIIVVAIAVVVTMILSGFYSSCIYKSEREKLASSYETEIENLNSVHLNEIRQLNSTHLNEINQLNNTHINETQQLESVYSNKTQQLEYNYTTEMHQLENERNNTLNQLTSVTSSFNSYETDTESYVRHIKNGFSDLEVADLNQGYGEAYYIEATDDYEIALFYLASLYAGYADVYYGYAYGLCELAEGHFKQAVNNAPSEHLKNLASLYVSYADYGSQINSEMHQANEYFASACSYFDLENYETGNSEIEEMNKHIIEHDRLVPLFNDVLADIEAWS